jgi:hypothetical protein
MDYTSWLDSLQFQLQPTPLMMGSANVVGVTPVAPTTISTASSSPTTLRVLKYGGIGLLGATALYFIVRPSRPMPRRRRR